MDVIVAIAVSIFATLLGVLPGVILWHSFAFKFISKMNLCISVGSWVLAMGLAIGFIVTAIDWSGELLMNLVGIALILLGLVYVGALLVLLAKYNEDAEDRERHLKSQSRQSVGS